MITVTLPKTKSVKYQNILKTQYMILGELEQLKAKMKVLGSLGRFENLARKGRQFAKKENIKLSDILKND